MPLIVTPGLLARRAEFYQQLASLLHAGVPLIKALELIRNNPPSPAFRQPVTHAIVRLGQGCSFTESLSSRTDWLPPFDLALLHAGEESGRLPDCCRLLAGCYEERARLIREVISALLYPLFLAHFALLVFPLSHLTDLVQSLDFGAFLGAKLMLILPAYIIALLLIIAAQGHRSESWRAFVERLLHSFPALGKARRHMALSRLAAALEALIHAGVTIIEAWTLAADASGSPALRQAVRRWQQPLAAGQSPADLLPETPEFPELFTNLYATGELSGQLDETLGRLHRHYREEGSRRLHLAAQWIPRILYVAILLGVAWYIIDFWLGYFDGIADAMGFQPGFFMQVAPWFA